MTFKRKLCDMHIRQRHTRGLSTIPPHNNTFFTGGKSINCGYTLPAPKNTIMGYRRASTLHMPQNNPSYTNMQGLTQSIFQLVRCTTITWMIACTLRFFPINFLRSLRSHNDSIPVTLHALLHCRNYLQCIIGNLRDKGNICSTGNSHTQR